MTIDPEIVAYISLVVQTVKRFIPKSEMQWAVPLITLIAGVIIGYSTSGTAGIEAGIIAAIAAIGVYEGPKQAGQKLVK